jgi:hypothetical protein
MIESSKPRKLLSSSSKTLRTSMLCLMTTLHQVLSQHTNTRGRGRAIPLSLSQTLSLSRALSLTQSLSRARSLSQYTQLEEPPLCDCDEPPYGTVYLPTYSLHLANMYIYIYIYIYIYNIYIYIYKLCI